MKKMTKSEAQGEFRGKAISYARVFDPKNQFVADVFKDLAKFCRAHDSTFHPDPRMAANMDGRREVWLRIQNFIRLDIEEIYKLHGIKD